VECPRAATTSLLLLLRCLPPRQVDEGRRRLGVEQILRDGGAGVAHGRQAEHDEGDADDDAEGERNETGAGGLEVAGHGSSSRNVNATDVAGLYEITFDNLV